MHEIDLRYRAKELEIFHHARVLLELHLAKMSAASLGEAEDPLEEELSDAELERRRKRREKEPTWIATGQRMKAEIREQLLYAFMPEHMQAAYAEVNGIPGEGPLEQVEALQGVSQNTAAWLLRLLGAKTFSRNAWATSSLWKQLQANEGRARKRLEKTAAG